ncbi:MAG: glycosyltransferase [Eubacteriales bacterium]
MEPKKKLLIIGIIMNCAGTEKSFLSFASCLDYSRFDVDLLLVKRYGELYDSIPKEINVLELPDREYADMFLLSGKNSVKTIWNCFCKKNPLILLEVLPFFIKILLNPKKRSDIATRLWCRLLQKFSVLEHEYDIAAAYWGDRTMFYMADKVKAKKKVAWLHFDYGNPPRDDELYRGYFKQCDNVITVSKKINETLVTKFPEIADRFITIENINNPKHIWNLALQGESFPDRSFTGKRLLTIARISEQKGLDLAIEALKYLCKDEMNVRWYIIGGGEKGEIDIIKAKAVEEGVAHMLILLGTKQNPYPFLRDCDIYVQPSRYEGKPITVEEAKIMYKPIVATNYVSASEQLDFGELGIITEINGKAIYGGIRRLLDDAALRDSFTMKLSKRNFGNSEEIEKFYKITENIN